MIYINYFMEQFNRDIDRLKQFPVLQGNSHLEITTRGISDIINSNNILETIKIMYFILICYNLTVINNILLVSKSS